MNDIVKAPTLQEKVSQRIREQIGELIDAADLKNLVEKAMHEAFFATRKQAQQYGNPIEKPPLIVDTVEVLMKKAVDEQIAGWMKDHDAEIAKMIESVVREGLLQVVMRALDAKVQGDLWTFGNSLSQRMVGRGL
jgi:hypothetical protein